MAQKTEPSVSGAYLGKATIWVLGPGAKAAVGVTVTDGRMR